MPPRASFNKKDKSNMNILGKLYDMLKNTDLEPYVHVIGGTLVVGALAVVITLTCIKHITNKTPSVPAATAGSEGSTGAEASAVSDATAGSAGSTGAGSAGSTGAEASAGSGPDVLESTTRIVESADVYTNSLWYMGFTGALIIVCVIVYFGYNKIRYVGKKPQKIEKNANR